MSIAGQYGVAVSLSKTKRLAVEALIGGDAIPAVEVEGGWLQTLLT